VATIALDDPDTRNSLSDPDARRADRRLRDGARRRRGALRRAHLDAREGVQLGRQPRRLRAEVPLVHKHAGIERFPSCSRTIGRLGKPTICAANGHVLAARSASPWRAT
jgi:enoyl-CoA hydratase/carnithine racemase